MTAKKAAILILVGIPAILGIISGCDTFALVMVGGLMVWVAVE